MLYNYAEAIELYGSDYMLKKAIREKRIYKVDKGIYSDGKDNFTKYEVAIKKYPSAFLVHDTALYVLGFIDQEPEVVHLGTARNALRICDINYLLCVSAPKLTLLSARQRGRSAFCVFFCRFFTGCKMSGSLV